jgi:hypothetical protein
MSNGNKEHMKHEMNLLKKKSNCKCCKWIFQIKYNVDCFVAKYNACLMTRGFSQVENIDFNETLSLVKRIKSIQIMLVIFTIISFKVFQMDVKTTFLNGELSKDIYIYIYTN